MENQSWRATAKAKKGRPSAIGIAIVAAIHTAGLAALLLAKPGLISPPEYVDPIDTYDVPTQQPEDIPPPPDANDLVETPVTPTPTDSRIAVEREVFIPLPPPRQDEIRRPVTSPPADPPAPPTDPVLTSAQPHPSHLAALQPRYPGGLRRSGTEGSVTVRVRIEANGQVSDVQLVSTDHPAFFEATQRHALRRWRFQPATRDGRPIASWYETTVRFRLA